MSDYRKNLVDRMIRQYGFEDPATIAVALKAEKWPDDEWYDRALLRLVETLESLTE